MEGEELQVELVQREDAVAVVVIVGDELLVPDHSLGGVERLGVELLELRGQALAVEDLKGFVETWD